MDTIETPLDLYRDRVRPEWIDSNDHLNMGYYVVVFDFATDAFLTWVGLGAEHRLSHPITTFSLESHVNYLREVRVGAPLRFTTRLVDFDEKRIHYFHEMWHAEENFRAATNELMSLHVSLESRRAAPMAPHVLERLARIREAHARLPAEPLVGRSIGLKARRSTA